MEPYKVPAADARDEFTEKKSRFIGHLFRIGSEEEARERLAALRREYWDAGHNVWAYVLRAGPVRFSDDGEPQGTAGRPTLEVLQREGVFDALCVTTRYFGGILLGAGGLTRAYARAAKLALDAAGIAELRPFALARLRCPYDLLEQVRHALPALECEERQADYGAEVLLALALPAEGWNPFVRALTELSAGRLRPERTGEQMLAKKLR